MTSPRVSMPLLRAFISVLGCAVVAGGCGSPASGPASGAGGSASGGTSGGTGGGSGSGGTSGGMDASAGGTGGSGTGGRPAPGSGGAGGSGGGSGGAAGQDAGADMPRDVAPVDLGPVMPVPATVSFAAHIAPIIAAKCSPCHTTEARGGNNWTYATLVTNSTVTSTTAACAPTATAPPPPNANRACEFMEGSGRRVVTGPNFELGLMWIKIVGHDGTLCGKACGSSMPPVASGKIVSTYERDVIRKWMTTGAMP